MCQGTWHITVKDDIALQFSWYFEIRKQYSSVVRLLRVYAANPFDWYSNVWHLIDPLELHVNSCTNRNNWKVEKSVSMHSDAFKRSYKAIKQIATDTKSRNASHICIGQLNPQDVKVCVILFISFLVFIIPVVLQFSLDFTKNVYIFNRCSYNIFEFIVVL